MSDFTTGLFGCMSDIGTCLYGTFCPVCLNLKTFSKLNEEECDCCYLLNPISEFWVRQTIRRRKHMKKEACCDTLTAGFCFACAICQDAREVNANRFPKSQSEYYAGINGDVKAGLTNNN